MLFSACALVLQYWLVMTTIRSNQRIDQRQWPEEINQNIAIDNAADLVFNKFLLLLHGELWMLVNETELGQVVQCRAHFEGVGVKISPDYADMLQLTK